ncbi:MAG: hypothetical protein BWY14_00034 [Parcubacteria group bacterium ADurb.Bin192]|nr:MAG: hypothetical protein BWY14_00034 [Parcubacteria group bacterium ADurb.Bin192]
MVVSGGLMGLAVGLARFQTGDVALAVGLALLVVNCGLLSLAIYWGRNATYSLLAGRTSGSPCVPFEHLRETRAGVLAVWFFIPLGAAFTLVPFLIYG